MLQIDCCIILFLYTTIQNILSSSQVEGTFDRLKIQVSAFSNDDLVLVPYCLFCQTIKTITGLLQIA